MARKRMIDPSIWEDLEIGKLSDAAFRLFICCISNADDEGKLRGDAEFLRALAFRYRNVTVSKVRTLLDELSQACRSFHRYEAEGREYIALLNWNIYQTIDRPSPSRIPNPRVPFAERSANTRRSIGERSCVIEGKRKEENIRARARDLAKGSRAASKERIQLPNGTKAFPFGGKTYLVTESDYRVLCAMQNPEYRRHYLNTELRRAGLEIIPDADN